MECFVSLLYAHFAVIRWETELDLCAVFVCSYITSQETRGAALLTEGRSYVGNDVARSTLLDRACACSYENLPKYRSYRVSKTAPCSGWCTAVHVAVRRCRSLTLNELCTSVSSRSITTHFLFRSWWSVGSSRCFCGVWSDTTTCQRRRHVTLWRNLSHHTMSYHVTPRHIAPCNIAPRHIAPRRTTSHHVAPRRTTSHHVIPYYTMSHHTMSHHAMSCHTTSYQS